MTKKRRSGKIAGQPKMKVWFPLAPLVDLLWRPRTEDGFIEMCRRLNVGSGNFRRMVDKPGHLIRETSADRYAIRARLSSLYDMARLV